MRNSYPNSSDILADTNTNIGTIADSYPNTRPNTNACAHLRIERSF